MALKFSMMLEAVDRVSAPAKRIKSNFSGLVAGARAWGQQVRKVSRDIDSGARSLEFYQTRARRLRQVALGSFFRAARMQARQFAGSLRSGIRNLHLMERAGRAAKSGLGWLGGKAVGLAKWGLAAGAAAGGFALFDLFRTAGQFEQYQIMLEGVMGSAKKGRQSMAWIKKFAETTPFELDGVTQAFLSIKNAGLDPMNGSLLAAGDAAAGMSEDITRSAEAMAAAINGEFDSLKAFGITARVEGDKVRVAWVKNEKEFSKSVRQTDKMAIAMAVAAAWSDKFAGSSERQSRTLFGIISNIKDLWSKFLNMIADAGVFDTVKRKLDGWREELDRMSKNGAMKDWAEKISKALESAFNWATDLVDKGKWKAFASDLEKIGKAAWTIAKGISDAVSSYQRWQAGRAAKLAENTEQGWFSSKSAKAKARERRQRLEREFGPLTETGEEEAARKERSSKFYRITPGGRDIPVGQGFRRLPTAGRKPQASASRLDVGGSTKVEIALKGPLTGRVRSVKANNPSVPLVVNTGRAMGGPA